MSIKTLSRLLLGAGVFLIVISVFMDITVGVEGRRVVNLYKASQQSNTLMLGGFLLLAGIIALVATKFKSGAAGNGQETTSSQTLMEGHPEFAGERAISSPPYQLFLTRLFSIEKNPTLEKYVIGNDVFDTLEESLSEADRRYKSKLDNDKQTRLAAAAVEQKLAAEREQRLKQQAKAKQEKDEAERQAKPIKMAKLKKIATVVGIILLIVIGAVTYIGVSESNRVAAIAKKEAEVLKAERDQRIKVLGPMVAASRLFDFSLGERNRKQLLEKLGPRSGKWDNSFRIECDADCNSLTGFNAVKSAVESVRFEYCVKDREDQSIENHELTKVRLVYKNADEAKADLYELKTGNYSGNWSLDAGVTQSIDLDSLKLSLERRRGNRDTCGN